MAARMRARARPSSATGRYDAEREQLGLVGGLAGDEQARGRAARFVGRRGEQAKRVGAGDELRHRRLVPRLREAARMQRRQQRRIARHGAM